MLSREAKSHFRLNSSSLSSTVLPLVLHDDSHNENGHQEPTQNDQGATEKATGDEE
jgi:hypothetical protein